MKCVICHSEQIIPINVNEEFNIGHDIIYVPIKIPVCKDCGERYYDRKTKQYLEKIGTELQKNKHNLKEIGKVLIFEK